MDDVINYIINKLPLGIVIFDQEMEIVYCNRFATNFLKRHEFPEEIRNISGRIFNAINKSNLNELFPGEICFSKKLKGSQSNWTFRFLICENPRPLVSICIMEQTISNRMDMNRLRKQYRLTRRETDILRRLLDGLKNVEIAEDLEISEQTVKDHLSNIYMKLGVENRFALVRYLMNSQKTNLL